MVTGGAMNPTATITALALRAAEHLADDAVNQRSLV
jgi:choline dehydrogenase-like flavoprotein